MAKRTIGAVMVALVALGLVACKPMFPEGSALDAEVQGSGVVLSWDEPTVTDPETNELAEYSVLVDGVEVSRVAGYVLGCRLYGLDDDTTYTIGVIAWDAQGRGSDPLTAQLATDFESDPGDELYCSTAPPEM